MDRWRPWAPGPAPRLRVVKDPEVTVESKEIRFLGKDQIGLSHSACMLERGEQKIQVGRGPEQPGRFERKTLETMMTIATE